MNYYRLPEAEYYDICAIAYLQAVKDWHSNSELRKKYRFSSIAFKKILYAKINKYHADRIRDAYIAFSLNDLKSEGNEYMEHLPDPYDALQETQERQESHKGSNGRSNRTGIVWRYLIHGQASCY